MKKIVTIIIFAIIFSNKITGQNMGSIIQQLINNGLLLKNEVKDFRDLVKRYNGDMKESTFLGVLFYIEYKRLTGHEPSLSSYISYGENKLNEQEQKKINFELEGYLSKLKNCDLINNKHYNNYKTKINQNEFIHSLQLLNSLFEQITQEEHLNTNKLILFANKLKSYSIVSTKYESLIADIKTEKITNPIDFLKYCENATLISEKDYSNKPEEYLELIHKKTAGILPNLDFKNFQFKIELDSAISSDDSKFYKFIISIISHGKTYRQKSSYHLYSPIKNEYFGNKISHQEYYKIFNKVLSDLQSPYRLHEVKSYIGNAENQELYGIIALTKDQAKVLRDSVGYFSPSYENFKNTLTTTQIEHSIEEYEKIGLFKNLTKAQIDKAKESVSLRENINLNYVLACFSNTILSFDTELANLTNPYAELVKKYGIISKNEFNPTEISDNFNKAKGKKVTLKFKYNGKKYEKQFNIENDWIDIDFFQYMDSIANDNNLKGKFYQLYTGGQDVNIIYLTPQQYDHLKVNKLAVFADEWESQIEDEK